LNCERDWKPDLLLDVGNFRMVALLMLNPLDSFRIDALFALEQIPAEAANKTPLACWWTAHAGAWFAGIAVVWSAMMITLASHRMKRWEE
jgi:hypothetical protein